MLFVFCLIAIFTSTFYAYKYLKRRRNKNRCGKLHALQSKKLNSKSTMSDDEFSEPWKANDRWKIVDANKVSNPGSSSIFRWKRRSTVSPTKVANENEKRQKIHINQKQKDSSAVDLIELTEDESESNINVNKFNQSTPLKTTLTNTTIDLTSSEESLCSDIKVYDKDSLEMSGSADTSNKDISKLHTNISEDEELSKKNLIPLNFIPIKSKYENVPLPPGMPPMIAGVPVKFPVTPYKSQISVMNAVIKGCKNSEHCLLESPTGSGKTLALLCAALAWQSQFEENIVNELVNNAKDTVPGNPYENTYSMDINEIIQLKMNQMKPKIYYGSRTHKQIEQVIREFRKTAYKDKPMTILSSREHSCLQAPQKGLSKTQICNNLLDPINKTSCKFYTDKNKDRMSSNQRLSMLEFQTPWDIEDLYELGREHESCPYFAARNLMAEADIIFCPYNYLLDPVIRDSMKIDLTNDIIIVDEAHNIESICRDVGSADFREDHLEEVMEDCLLVYNISKHDAYEYLHQYLKLFLQLIRDQALPEANNPHEEVTSNCWTGEEAWTLFKMHKMGDAVFSQFKNSCNTAIEQYKSTKEDIQNENRKEMQNPFKNVNNAKDELNKKKKAGSSITFITKKLLEELLMALSFIQSSQHANDYRCFVSNSFRRDAKMKISENTWLPTQGGKWIRTFKFMCMNPGMMFSQITTPARSVILASGTLSPTSTFESELDTKFAHKLHANHVVPKEQVYVRGIPCGPKGTTLRATYKNVHSLPFKDDLGRLIVEVCQTVPHGVLCFFSSYTMMTSQIERWQETDVWRHLEGCKVVLTEPRSNNDLDETMRTFREMVRNTSDGPSNQITGPLLFAVFRGKVAEGIDFSDNEARCVLTIGIPYAVQNDPAVKLKREYNDANRSKGLLPGGEWYSVQAYRALNQALGRCIRHRDDWGAVLLVDDRLLSSYSANYLPKWIREMRLDGLKYNLREELKTFVKRQQVRDQTK